MNTRQIIDFYKSHLNSDRKYTDEKISKFILRYFDSESYSKLLLPKWSWVPLIINHMMEELKKTKQ